MLLTMIGPSRMFCSSVGIGLVRTYPYLPDVFLSGAENVLLMSAGVMMLTLNVMLLPPGPLNIVSLALDVTPRSTAVPVALPLPIFDPLGQALRRLRALVSVATLQEGNSSPRGAPTPAGNFTATFSSR